LVKEATTFPPSAQQRIVAANYRRGTTGNAKNLVAMAGDGSLDPSTRACALHALRLWEKQITTDPVLGDYRPQTKAERGMKALGKTIDGDLRELLSHDLPAQLSALALQLADETGVRLEPATLKAFVVNSKLDNSLRVAALGSLIRSVPNEAPALIFTLLDDPDPAVAAAALSHGFALKLDGLAETARRAIQSGPLEKARAAIFGLGSLESPEITVLWENRQNSGLRRELWLDLFLVLQTSTKTKHQTLASTFAATATDAVFRLSETGGDSLRGEKIFRNQGACLQCHKMGANGGIQGPTLTHVGERLTPAKLVESLVNPNAEIAQGYGLAAITLADGKLVMGRIARQTKEQINLIGIDGKETKLSTSTVVKIAPPVSAMPPLGLSLPPRDLRDLIAYLTTRNAASMGPESDDSSHGEKEKEKAAR
jgi:quinoprotein glucose dehydrogenase